MRSDTLATHRDVEKQYKWTLNQPAERSPQPQMLSHVNTNKLTACAVTYRIIKELFLQIDFALLIASSAISRHFKHRDTHVAANAKGDEEAQTGHPGKLVALGTSAEGRTGA